MTEKVIYFDMDGTFVNLYGVENWLDDLIAENTRPYAIAKPLFNMNTFARVLNSLKKKGYKIGIVSWLSKCGTDSYNKAVTDTKIKWIKTHLKSVEFDEINIVKYGTPKSTAVKVKNSILFDDELKNREEWKGTAYNVDNIINILKSL